MKILELNEKIEVLSKETALYIKGGKRRRKKKKDETNDGGTTPPPPSYSEPITEP